MIAAIIILSVALLGVSVYAATLRARLGAARAETLRPEQQEQRFREIASALLSESQERLNASATSKMNDLLSPLQRNIETFNRVIDEKYSREAAERGALREKIDELRRLNESLGSEARQLADALRGNGKVQGDWGEMILETLLVQAGFTEGREFSVQTNVRDSEGRNLRPDVVVNFPDGGCVVIDSKASLTAYVNLCSAPTDEARAAATRAHVLSVRNHVRELAVKNYHDLVGSDRRLDFTMMFIPNEGAYIAAMQAEPDLWQEAYNRHVLIVSPTHLFSVLKLISQMWRHDAQQRNARQIADEAGKLYDKFVGFYNDLTRVGDALNRAQTAHSDALRKLSEGPGNLVGKAEKLRDMGAKTSKSLPSIKD
ncbi:MAG: DNA recombination protein RmuC [Muribaculaceae bacterium]|nr:DNA recombination protein RmuC [Muribaculaceae bacterium]